MADVYYGLDQLEKVRIMRVVAEMTMKMEAIIHERRATSS